MMIRIIMVLMVMTMIWILVLFPFRGNIFWVNNLGLLLKLGSLLIINTWSTKSNCSELHPT
jgi:hypothetical protein